MPTKITRTSDLSATVSSRGRITLPRAVRARLGIRVGSRIRFTLAPGGGFAAHLVLYELEDLWAMADQFNRSGQACRGSEGY
jgi:AbrB family looped-hinge helix DNA binding protein